MNQFKELFEETEAEWQAKNDIRMAKHQAEYIADRKFQDDWENAFNKDWERLAKTKKLAGYDFSVKMNKYDTLVITTAQPHKGGTVGFSIEFIDDTRGQKIAKVIQIASDAKRGVIEKKVSGRNATADKIWAKLDKFFTYGKWA